MGLWGHRHRCLAATASALGSISLCRRRNAIFREEVSGGADAWPSGQILPPGVPGSALWTASAHSYLATRTSGPRGGYRLYLGGDNRSLFFFRQQNKKKGTTLDTL